MQDDRDFASVGDEGAVPAFALFGETDSAALSACHIEKIADRSQARDWTITPHLHRGLVQVLVLFDGFAQVSVDGAEKRITAPAALTIPMAAVHGFHFSEACDGYVCTLRQTMLDAAPVDLVQIQRGLFSKSIQIDLHASPSYATRLRLLCDAMQAAREDSHGAMGETAEQLTVLAILATLEEARRAVLLEDAPQHGRRRLMRRYAELLNQTYTEHLSTADYAARLNISESTLDRRCREMTGKSAFRLLQDRILLEARRRLAYTRASASEISDALGFSDLAYFSRFFKKKTGMSPTEYRASLQDWR